MSELNVNEVKDVLNEFSGEMVDPEFYESHKDDDTDEPLVESPKEVVEDIFEEYDIVEYIKEVHTRACDASTKLKIGMKASNMSLNGGFESGRCYVYLGLPGEGNTLLNLALQIKKNNPEVKTKDPTKKPVVVFLTTENTLNETVERIFNMVETNGITVSDNNPVGLEFRYVPSVDTDYLYTLYDELMADGKECICMIQDRIKCRDFKLINGDMRIGAVIDEFKEFANTKKIPVITASQMNSYVAKIIDESRRTNKADLVSNIGESNLITENADVAFILLPYQKKVREVIYALVHQEGEEPKE